MNSFKLHMVDLCNKCFLYCAVLEPKPQQSYHGGGVAIYIKDSIRFKQRNDISTNEREAIRIEVEPPKANSFLVLALYRSPSDTVEIYDKIEKILTYLDKEGKELILLGDTNCDMAINKMII